jgi:uncharacterized membrane protein YagU involved in acid resistance
MAETTERELDFGARLAIGAIAGFVATMALTSTVRKLHKRQPQPAEKRPELSLTLSFAYGAACGAMLAAANPKPGRLTGALAGGGLWLAGQMGWFPSFAALPDAEKASLRGGLTSLGGHLAWGMSTAKAMRELGGVHGLLAAPPPDAKTA